MKNLLGNYAEMAEKIADSLRFPYSYLDDKWDDIDIWQKLVRGKVLQLLSYNPPRKALNQQLISKFEYDGVQAELVSWDQPYGPPTQAYLLKPLEHTGKSGRLPAVVALHDHSGLKYYGKEKVTAVPGESEYLVNFKKNAYGGVSWASRLAKQGYAVLAPDIFLWGSRRLIAEEVSGDHFKELAELEKGSDDYIGMYNHLCGIHETMVAKSLFMAGTTWPGIMLYEDMRAVDYLLTRDDIDHDRIGCGGLSGGGEQTIFLAGMDSRIKCAVCVCFMNTCSGMVQHNIAGHSWMVYAPLLAGLIDLPDLITLSGGRPAMVQYRSGDPLFDINGQKASHDRIGRVYSKMGKPELYNGVFYPGEHEFDLTMQDEAFAWYDRWLK